MIALELTCFGIIGMWLWLALRRAETPRRVFSRWLLLAGAAWIGEDTCIRTYGFYSYSPDWDLFIDRVPLLVVLIWPIVILSAYELAAGLLGRFNRHVPLLGGFIVLTDAAFIEPIAVAGGLWRWFEPGFFDVPPIGIIGWALFGFACLAVFSLNDRFGVGGWADVEVILLAPVFVHSALIALWWSFFRSVSQSWSEAVVVIAVWGLSVGLFRTVRHRGLGKRMDLVALASRIPAALFFVFLLLLKSSDDLGLLLYSAAFVPPYLALMSRRDSPPMAESRHSPPAR